MRSIQFLASCLTALACAAGCNLSDDEPGGADATPVPPDAAPDTPEPPLGFFPRTCADVKTYAPRATDGSHRLFVGGDIMKPFTAYCDGMDGDAPREYLALRAWSGTADAPSPTNVSLVYLNDSATAADNRAVRTYFSMVRLDVDAMAIDIADTTHSTTIRSHTSVIHRLLSDDEIRAVAFGVAIHCGATSGIDDFDPPLQAKVDLTGTSFKLTGPAATQFVKSATDASITGTDDARTAILEPAIIADVCNSVAPRGHTQPLINTAVGAAGLLPVLYVPPAS